MCCFIILKIVILYNQEDPSEIQRVPLKMETQFTRKEKVQVKFQYILLFVQNKINMT